MRLLTILFITLFVQSYANAQNEYKGWVVDKAKRPVQDVSVVISRENASVIDYGFTDESGYFEIKCTADANPFSISFILMGYETLQVPLAEFSNEQTFVLKSKDFTLKEVNIRPDKITQNKDTLSYNVLSFKQGQDRSIADVIAKMPGLEVKPNGQITFEGKPINKFYIEGMDLMGNKYAQASENLSADMVRSVQVIQNHQPIKTLRGIQFSDQAALNIVLKEDVKNAWAGTLDVGAGSSIQGSNDYIYSGRLMGMLFGRKQQNLSMYKGDNTGKDIAKEIADVAMQVRDNQQEEGLLKGLILPAPEIDNRRVTFNNSHLVATNHLIRTKQENDVRIQLDYLWDKQGAYSSKSTTYYDMDGIVLSEENNVTSDNKVLKGDFTYKANKDNFYINNRVHGNLDFDRSWGNSTLENGQTEQNIDIRRSHITEDFEMISRLKNGNSINFSSQTTYSYVPGTLLTIGGFTERLDVSALESHNYTSFSHKVIGFTLNHRVGFKHKSQQIDVKFQDVVAEEKYSQQNLYASSSLNLERKSIKLRATLKADAMHRSYQGNDAIRLTLQPNLNIQYEHSATSTTSVNYSYTERPNDLMDIFRTPLYTSYRTLMSHSGSLENRGMHTAYLYWKYQQPIKGNFLNAMFSWTHRTNEILYSSLYVAPVYHRTPTDHRYNADTYLLSGNAAHSFYWGKTLISLNAQQIWSSYYLLLQDVMTPGQMRNTEVTFKMSMQPTRIFSYELASQMQASKQINKNNSTLSSDGLMSFKHSASLYLFPFKNVELGTEWAIYHSSDHSVSNNIFTDAHLSYHFKQCELRLNCNNIFGTHLYERQIKTSITDVYSIYRLRPREIMLCCSIDF